MSGITERLNGKETSRGRVHGRHNVWTRRPRSTLCASRGNALADVPARPRARGGALERVRRAASASPRVRRRPSAVPRRRRLLSLVGRTVVGIPARGARALAVDARFPPRDRVDDDLDDLDGDDAVPVHEPRVATRTDDPGDDWDHPADAAVRAEWESYWRNLRARRRLAEHGTRRRWPGPLITIGEWGRGYDTERPDRWTPRVVSRSRESRDTYPHAAPASAPAAAAADPDDDAWIRNPSSAGASVPEGLSLRTLRALPHVVFESRGGTIVRGGGSECAVCLADFEPGEELVRLPRCGHFFHRGCVSPWLERHRGCPKCRTEVDEMHANDHGNTNVSEGIIRVGSAAAAAALLSG